MKQRYRLVPKDKSLTFKQALSNFDAAVAAITNYRKGDKKTCYQCEKEVDWLAPDSRCGDCTGYTVDEIRGS